MVREIRDLETAEMAVQSALTGHLVFSTLHTNDAATAFTRLVDMEVEEYLVASTVRGVLAQRLVRRICPDCRVEYRANAKRRKGSWLNLLRRRPSFTTAPGVKAVTILATAANLASLNCW